MLIFDYCINTVFFLEFIFKVISMGFLFDNGCYLRDYLNILDFFIVTFSIIDMSFSD